MDFVEVEFVVVKHAKERDTCKAEQTVDKAEHKSSLPMW
jgi:hypothetical protein